MKDVMVDYLVRFIKKLFDLVSEYGECLVIFNRYDIKWFVFYIYIEKNIIKKKRSKNCLF